jgi:dipeptidyl aminopeptidase/acylaminoacyl peptidase
MQPFDPVKLEVTGRPLRIANQVGYGQASFIDRAFSVSAAGRLVVAEGTWQLPRQLTWLDRSGKNLGTVGRMAETLGLWLSADRSRALVERHDANTNLTGPWVIDLTAGTESRLTQTAGESIELTPTWSVDEASVYFSTLRGIFKRQVRGGQVVRLIEQDRAVWIQDRSPDGKYLVYEKGDSVNQTDTWLLSLEGTTAARPLIAGRYYEAQARVSPDGRALAYVSDENGRREVFLDVFPEPQLKVAVSTTGGVMPEWRPDGRELYFLNDGMLMAVTVDTTTSPVRVGRPAPLFKVPPIGVFNSRHQYQPSATGDRFLVNATVPTTAEPPMHVLLNWPAVTAK